MNETDSSATVSRPHELSGEEKQDLCTEQIEFEFSPTVAMAPKKKNRRRKAFPSTKSRSAESEISAEGCRDRRKDALCGDSKDAVCGSYWIKNVRSNIQNTRNLREAVALSACYLAELIDLEVETRGYCDEWKYAYLAYCAVQLFSFTPEDDEESGTPRLAWAFAALIFHAYENSNKLTDWHLFEELCCDELAPEDADRESAEAYTIKLFSSCLWAIHDIVRNGGAKVFSAKHSCSAE